MGTKEIVLIIVIPVLLYLIIKGLNHIHGLYKNGHISYMSKVIYSFLVVIFPLFYFLIINTKRTAK